MELTGFSYLSLFIWVGLGFMAGFLVYLRDRKGTNLITIFITAVAGSIGGGILSGLIFNRRDTIFDLLSAIVSLAGAYLLSLVGLMLRNLSENEVRLKENDWEDFAYSQVSRPSSRLLQLEQFLDQVEFPISNRDLIRHAEKNLADGRQLNLLERLPDHIYQTKAEILNELKPLINLGSG